MGGAVEKVWFALGKEFARRGHDVTHISRKMEGLPDAEVIDGVRHQRVRGFDQPKQLVWLKLLDLIYSLRVRRILPVADILVTNTFWLPLLIRHIRFGLLHVQVQRAPRGQMRWYRHAARLLAVSRAIADAIICEAPDLAAKVRVIPNALPFAVRDRHTVSAAAPIVLYVGRIHPEKGLESLLQAATELPTQLAGWKLRLVGSHEFRHGGGGDDFVCRLKRLAERSVLEVQWMGPVFDESELIRHYQSAALFVYPSAADAGEALPVAPLEAMANGCPSLVSDLACFDDYIEDGVTGFVFRQKQLVDRLSAVMQMPADDLHAVGRAAQERVKEFGADRIAERYLQDFETLLHPAHG